MIFLSIAKSRKIRISLISLVLVIAGFIFGLYQFNRHSPDLSKSRPDFSLTSQELYSVFEQDEEAANQKFVGKIVEVTGMVAQVG